MHVMEKFPNNQNKKSKSQQVSVSQSTSIYSGKLPPPEMMEHYNKLEPNFANRIILMAEQEQKHIHSIEKKQLNVSVLMAVFGILAGLIALSTLCYLIYLSIIMQNTGVALGIVGIIGTVVTIFVLDKRKSTLS
jgi:uncharacterized membrane protein